MSRIRLLEKQIKKYLPSELTEREDIRQFLEAVNNSYASFERDRALSAHAFSISEQEYALINQQLQDEVSLRRLGVKNLGAAIRMMEGSDSLDEPLAEEEDNLPFALSYLERSVARRKTMEQELKDSESRLSASAKTFSQLIKNLNYGVLLEDAGRKVVLANQLFCDMLSIPLTPDMLVGMDCNDMSSICKRLFRDPDDFLARMRHIIYARELVTGDELQMTDGKVMLRDYIPIYVDNEYKGNLWTFKDITRERETGNTLHRLSLVASANEHGVLFTDPAGMITWANEGFSRLTGYGNAEAVGKTPIELCKGALTDKESLRAMLTLFRTGKSFAVEVAYYRKDGTWFWGKVKGQPLADEQGRITQYFAIIEDFSEKKQLERELIEAKELAEQSSRAKESFLANMSHEIRTPMNAVLGMSRLLQKTALDDKQHFYLNTILSSADHLLVVINDILDISKIEAGRLVLENIGFSLEEAAARVHRVMFHKAEEKGLQLSFDMDPAIPAVLTGDPHRLNQVLLNLVSNAIKFTSKGSVHIAYVLEPAVSGDDHKRLIKITVSDTGIGMDEDFLPHLFRKFVQEDGAVARKFGGTGLGMSICKQLTELMGGTIHVSSRKGEGTTVVLHLPLRQGDCSSLPEKEALPDAGALYGKRILLVEDNEMNRLVATTILSNAGVVVHEALHGAEAIHALQQQRYDLVLMDMQMPVMDGLEASRIIRRDIDPKIPIIALTANAIKGESDKCMEAGMNDYLSKPFEEEELIRILARWLAASCSSEKPCHAGPITASAAALYDLTKLKAIARGNDEFVSHMIRLFLEQVPVAVQQINDALASDNRAVMKAITHRIRPVIDNMGIVSLTKEMKEIEALAVSKNDDARLRELIEKMNDIISRVAASLLSTFDYMEQPEQHPK